MNRQERGEQLNQWVKESIAELEALMAKGKSEYFVKSLEWWAQLRHYSWGNSLLIKSQRPDATCVAGFRKFEALSFHVKQGERACWIRAPRFKKLPDPETGELKEKLIGWLAVPVFDIAQTREYPDKQPPNPYQVETTADWEYLYDVWTRRLLTLYGVEVKEMDMGALTFGLATSTRIHLNSSQDISIKAMTLIHETAHIAAKHTDRAERAKWSLQQREMHVEAASFVLCKMLGVTHPNAANYLLHYQVEPEMLEHYLDVINRIVKDVRHMLGFDELQKTQATEAA